MATPREPADFASEAREGLLTVGLTMLDVVAMIGLAVFTGVLIGWHLFSLDAQRLKKPVQMLDPQKVPTRDPH